MTRRPPLSRRIAITMTALGLAGLAAGCTGGDPTLDDTASAEAFRDPVVYQVELETVELDTSVLAQAGIAADGSFLAHYRLTGSRHSDHAVGLVGWGAGLGIETAIGPVSGPDLSFAVGGGGLVTNRSLLAGGVSLQIDLRSGLIPKDEMVGFCDFELDPSSLPDQGGSITLTGAECQLNPFIDPGETPYYQVLDQTVKSATFLVTRRPLAPSYRARLARVAISDYLKSSWDDNIAGLGHEPDPMVTVRYGGGAPQPGAALSNTWQWDAGLDIASDQAGPLTDQPIEVTVDDCDQGLFQSACDPRETVLQCTAHLDPIDLVAGRAYFDPASCDELESAYDLVDNLGYLEIDLAPL